LKVAAISPKTKANRTSIAKTQTVKQLQPANHVLSVRAATVRPEAETVAVEAAAAEGIVGAVVAVDAAVRAAEIAAHVAVEAVLAVEETVAIARSE
jgi:hypothetical protein